MLKFSKIVCILLIIFLVANVTVFATNIDMNLTQNETSENAVDTNSETTDGDNNTAVTDNGDTSTTQAQGDIGGSAAPSGVSSIAQENMSFSNILNILIITVGVILILLAIAILIRLKG